MSTADTATVEMRFASNILQIRIRKGAHFTVEAIREYLTSLTKLVGSNACGIMIFGHDEVVLDPGAKEIIIAEHLSGIKAMAIINPGDMAALQIATYMLNVGRSGVIPMKIFTDELMAKVWVEKELTKVL